MSGIDEKIAEIRSKPEHIRLRWVYGLVAISMLLVLFVWILSMKVSMTPQPDDDTTSIQDIRDTVNDTLQKTPGATSIDDLIEEGRETIDDTKEAGSTLQGIQEQFKEEQGDPGVSLDTIIDDRSQTPEQPLLERE